MQQLFLHAAARHNSTARRDDDGFAGECDATFNTDPIANHDVNAIELRVCARNSFPAVARGKEAAFFATLPRTAPRRCSHDNEYVRTLQGVQVRQHRVPEILAHQNAESPAGDREGLDASATSEIAAFVEHAIGRQIDFAMNETDPAVRNQCSGIEGKGSIVAIDEPDKRIPIEVEFVAGAKRSCDGMNVVAQIVPGQRQLRGYQQIHFALAKSLADTGEVVRHVAQPRRKLEQREVELRREIACAGRHSGNLREIGGSGKRPVYSVLQRAGG